MDNYKKIRLVGRGAYGTVFLCKQASDNKLVITKEIPVDQMTVDERQVSMNEAKVLAMIDHPNVIAYYDSFLEDKTMIIVMEYVQGGTLFDFLCQREGQLMTEQEVLHYFGQMVYTLQHVHAKLILHRDLKSQNVLLNEKKNIVKIGDFGISKVLSSKSKAYTVVGTPCYISPELCEGKPYNQKSDIWALGCILYELMTLKRPFDATTLPALIMKIMKGNFDPVSSIYSHGLKKLLLSMLHLDSNQRPTAAQIMCHPVMIKVIFQLYVEVGSIPCANKSQKNISFSKRSDSNLNAVAACKIPLLKESNETLVWLFESQSTDPIALPIPSEYKIKSAALGMQHKVGITLNGVLVNWIIPPTITTNSDTEESDKPPEDSYIATLIDEQIAIHISSVVCGEYFTVCLSDNGVVFTFGKASSGCLGFSTEVDIQQPRIVEALFGYNIKSIACGPRHALALSDENEAFAWGYGNNGCLGLGATQFQDLPHLIHIRHEKKPHKISCGVDSSFIITEDLQLLACGSNRHNKLAMDAAEGCHVLEKSSKNNENEIDEGSVHKSSKNIHYFNKLSKEYHGYFQIEEIRYFTLVKSEPLRSAKVVAVSAGQSHSVVLTDHGDLYSVGSNRFGQLGWGEEGLDYSMPHEVDIIKNIKVSQIVCGYNFTGAITYDNVFYCWGKCPNYFKNKAENLNCKPPYSLDNKCVLSVSCFSENCIIVGRNV
ncbi:hypothetical protein JTE90_013910 [Oedothorax gibbosus]|uniref:non-specific serine/threonine protein kinase n=1 Tax=Oedothorax gibbosus TaxID=931172 RepID=A0AAV6UEX2_9ARAC|nr:hypothetical protein JTE90_013910 [Oedothorax gibbosus]